MNRETRRWAILLVLISSVTLAAQRQGSPSHSPKTADDSEWSQFAGSMDKMHAAISSIEPSGDGDIDFVKLMFPHHRAAIDMAKTELVYGKDPQIRRLAQEIVTDQQSEIELMQLWLKQHGQNAPKIQ